MYCPQCGNQNIDTAQFCRTCGLNVSLVPSAISGELEKVETPTSKRGRTPRPPSLDYGFKKLFTGVAFLIIALILMRTGEGWGIWMLIPGFIGLGRGLAQIIGARQLQLPPSSRLALHNDTDRQIQSHNRNGVIQPSVTEGTTRNLGSPPADRL